MSNYNINTNMKWDVEHRTRAETVRITGKRALVEQSHDGIRGPGVFLHGTIRRKWATWKRKKEDMITERKCLLIKVPPRGRSRLIPSLGKVSSDELQVAPSQDY